MAAIGLPLWHLYNVVEVKAIARLALVCRANAVAGILPFRPDRHSLLSQDQDTVSTSQSLASHARHIVAE